MTSACLKQEPDQSSGQSKLSLLGPPHLSRRAHMVKEVLESLTRCLILEPSGTTAGNVASSSSHSTRASVASLSAKFGTSVKNPDVTLGLNRSERAVVARLEEQVQEMLTEKQAAEQAKEDFRINALRHIQNIENS